MAKHEVQLRIEHAVPVGNKDIEIPVRADNKPLGRLKISTGGVDWLPSPNSRKSFAMSWEKLAEVMEAQGRSKLHR
jgi:hypothetical protein